MHRGAEDFFFQPDDIVYVPTNVYAAVVGRGLQILLYPVTKTIEATGQALLVSTQVREWRSSSKELEKLETEIEKAERDLE